MGLEMSPYTMKMYAYLEFKGVPFEWEPRNIKTEKKFQAHAQVQLIPMLFRPDGTAMQDSTLMMEQEIEPNFPEPSVYPVEPAARFISELLEEFGDEWCNKLMFFQRWGPKEDRQWTGKRLAQSMFGVTWWGRLFAPIIGRLIVRRMVPRLSFAGGSPENIPHLQKSWETLLADMEAHLVSRPYLFGGRPTLADFSIFGQWVEAYSDVSGGRYIRASHPLVESWIARMHRPGIEGDFEPLNELMPTLGPLLKNSVAALFLPWTEANARAWAAGEPTTSLYFDGELYSQKTFKYHAYSRNELFKKYNAVKGDTQLRQALSDSACLEFFERGE